MECPHCFSQIDERATRCPNCAGEFRYCDRCARTVPVTVREVFKGVLRGGKQRVVQCGVCKRALEGSRW
jgi:uncharacterized CHY-type Zn-finger protein